MFLFLLNSRFIEKNVLFLTILFLFPRFFSAANIGINYIRFRFLNYFFSFKNDFCSERKGMKTERECVVRVKRSIYT